MENFIDIVSGITILLCWIYPIFYLKSFAENSKAFKIFTIYLVVIAIIQATMKYINDVLDQQNLFLFIYYFILQFVLLSLFYKELLNAKWIYLVTIVALVFFGVQYVMEPDMYYRYNPIGASVAQGIIVIYSIMYFYKCLSEQGEFLIVNVGIFMYLLSSTLIFSSGNLVFDLNFPKTTAKLLTNINLFLYLAFQLLIIVEYWKNYSSSKTE